MINSRTNGATGSSKYHIFAGDSSFCSIGSIVNTAQAGQGNLAHIGQNIVNKKVFILSNRSAFTIGQLLLTTL